MTDLALITGGTSGIGLAFARQLAARGYDLVLVARDQVRLDAVASDIASSTGRRVTVMPADLSTDEGQALVVERLSATVDPVSYLVNNAGFGMKGGFAETALAEHDRMIRVNIQAVLHFAHAALNQMLPRNAGTIINVSSTAGLAPGFRRGSTYAASKAFVTALSEGLSVTAQGSDVHVSAVLPGFVKTDFHQRAGMGHLKMPWPILQRPDFVAKQAIAAAERGEAICITGLTYKTMALAIRLAPRFVVRRVAKRVGRKNHK